MHQPYVKKNFNVDDQVKFVKLNPDSDLYDATGTILGKYMEGETDSYIVLLDNPFIDRKAVVILEGCLEHEQKEL